MELHDFLIELDDLIYKLEQAKKFRGRQQALDALKRIRSFSAFKRR